MTAAIPTMIDAMPKIHWRTDEQAFRAPKWFKPEAVRLIRAAFDVGSTELELRALVSRIEEELRDRMPDGQDWPTLVKAAVAHMASHPGSGLMRWLDNGQWDWVG